MALQDQGSVAAFGLQYISIMRIVRLVRLIRTVPQLQLMIVSIWRAVPPIIITLLLLAMLTFVFALLLKESAGVKFESFNSFQEAMLTLLVNGVFMDSPGMIIDMFLRADYYIHAIGFIIYILLCGYMVMNLLIGILCEIVHEATQTEQNTRDEQYLRDNLIDVLECYDRNDDGYLNRHEFNLAVANPDLKIILNKCSVDTKDLLSYGEVLFAEEESRRCSQKDGLRIEKFLHLVLRLRRHNNATVADIVALREYLDHFSNHMRCLMTSEHSEHHDIPGTPRISL
jgi:hypothetical protein